MPRTFLDMKNLLKDEANKGDSVNALLASKIQGAVLWIERNYTLRYMERFVSTRPELATSYPFSIELPPNIKALRAVRLVDNPDGAPLFTPLEKVQPEEITQVVRGAPDVYAYWTVAQKYLYFNFLPSATFALEIVYDGFSGTFDDSDAPWIFEFGHQAVLAQAMVLLSPSLRSPELMQMYAEIVKLEMPTLLNADDEYRYTGTVNVMRAA